MLHLDLKYINMSSHRFQRFARKDDYLFNFRCPLCGDSDKKKNKARGYLYKKRNDMFYKCHNCDHGTTFGNLLKIIDPLLHKQYVLERYTEGNAGHTGKQGNNNPEKALDFKFEAPDFSGRKKDKLIDSLMDRVDKLSEACGTTHTHIAVEYCKSRQIPQDVWSRLYHIDDISTISQLAPKYKDRIKTTEPRLAIPFFSEDGQLTGLTLRDYGNSSLRYIMVKIVEDAPTIFGLDVISKDKPVKIVEGPLDSLFLTNSIACAGTAFNKITPGDNDIIIIDNQPHNVEVCNILLKHIRNGTSVVIWPESLEPKDINEMVLAGVNVEEVISNNTFRNLEAELKYTTWRKC